MTAKPNAAISEIDGLIRSSLSSLVDDISSSGWTGRREREVVSLFCFGHLLQQCKPDTFLHDVTQISIEVAVPQVIGQVGRTGKATSKVQVCKDVVIWPTPRMTCWDAGGNPTVRPTSIIEWKHNEGVVYAYDVDWLREFSAGAEDFVGYAVSTNHGRPHNFRLSCTRIYRGEAQSEWLLIK
jgi:hypothetical protein